MSIALAVSKFQLLPVMAGIIYKSKKLGLCQIYVSYVIFPNVPINLWSNSFVNGLLLKMIISAG